MHLESFRTRIYIIAGFVLLFALILIVRLFSLQVLHSSEYQDRAEHQYITVNKDIFDRGTIFFSYKDGTTLSAATTTTGFKLAILPKNIVNPEEYVQKITAILPNFDATTFLASATKKNDPYEEVATRISETDANALIALKLPGVQLVRQKWRIYPGGSLAAQDLGFVGYKGDELIGRYGLERSYQQVLALPPEDVSVNFFAEVFGHIRDTVFTSHPDTGDIVTSIEPNVQRFLEKELADTRTRVQGQEVGGIIMDPFTGEIIAMAADPSFDPNAYGDVSNEHVFSNPTVESVFEAGSVIKPLVMAGALDMGVVTPNTTYFDHGSVIVDGKTINNFDKRGRGANTTMQTVLNQSLNTGMVFVAGKMGNDAVRKYLLSYGFGEKTGIDVPGEVAGLVSNLHSPRNLEYATAAFGQGIAVTPIEAIKAFAALANGGTLVTPHIATKILTGSTEKVLSYPMGERVLSKQATDTVTNMLIHVIDDGYAVYHVGLPHYTVAGKTGTAQMAKEDGKGYYTDKHTHSLFGYFPATNPRFVMYMYVRDPKGVQFAIQSFNQPFFETVKYLLNYYNVPPDR